MHRPRSTRAPQVGAGHRQPTPSSNDQHRRGLLGARTTTPYADLHDAGATVTYPEDEDVFEERLHNTGLVLSHVPFGSDDPVGSAVALGDSALLSRNEVVPVTEGVRLELRTFAVTLNDWARSVSKRAGCGALAEGDNALDFFRNMARGYASWRPGKDGLRHLMFNAIILVWTDKLAGVAAQPGVTARPRHVFGGYESVMAWLDTAARAACVSDDPAAAIQDLKSRITLAKGSLCVGFEPADCMTLDLGGLLAYKGAATNPAVSELTVEGVAAVLVEAFSKNNPGGLDVGKETKAVEDLLVSFAQWTGFTPTDVRFECELPRVTIVMERDVVPLADFKERVANIPVTPRGTRVVVARLTYEFPVMKKLEVVEYGNACGGTNIFWKCVNGVQNEMVAARFRDCNLAVYPSASALRPRAADALKVAFCIHGCAGMEVTIQNVGDDTAGKCGEHVLCLTDTTVYSMVCKKEGSVQDTLVPKVVCLAVGQPAEQSAHFFSFASVKSANDGGVAPTLKRSFPRE